MERKIWEPWRCGQYWGNILKELCRKDAIWLQNATMVKRYFHTCRATSGGSVTPGFIPRQLSTIAFKNLDSRAHTTPRVTFSFLSVHLTEEPKGNSVCVNRASNNSRNVKLQLPTRMRAACAIIGRGTQLNKGWVSSQELLLQLIQINDNTIAVYHSWESLPTVYSVVMCVGGSTSGTVTSASPSWVHTLQSDNSESSLDRESSDSRSASASFFAGTLL